MKTPNPLTHQSFLKTSRTSLSTLFLTPCRTMASPIERIVEDEEGIFGDLEESRRFIRRFTRAVKLQPKAWKSSEEITTSALRIDTDHEKDFPFSVENLAPLADNSATAYSLLSSAIYAARGKEALDARDIRTAAIAFSKAYRKNSMVVRWDFADALFAKTVFDALAHNQSEEPEIRAHALHTRAHLLFFQGELIRGLQHLRLAQTLLPEDGCLHEIEGCLFAMLLKKNEALNAFTRASQLGCDNIQHTLFHRAVLTEDNLETPRKLLEEFVSRAEGDARKLPEACYRLSMLHGMKGPSNLGAARRYYDLGLKADRLQLPCFPDAVASMRKQAEALVKKYHSCGNVECVAIGTSLCSKCKKVYYCSRACQLNDWKTHKEICKTLSSKQK
jgi:tetratricopeptide (TPR) repeat protein